MVHIDIYPKQGTLGETKITNFFKMKERKIMKKNNKGFSLVELIVVVLIMAIIATALTLAVTKYVAKSKRSSDANTAGELKTAAETAVTDYLTSVEDLGKQKITITGAKNGGWSFGSDQTGAGFKAADFKKIFESAAGTGAPTSKVHPNSSFVVTVDIDDVSNATYSVNYTEPAYSTVDIFKEATK